MLSQGSWVSFPAIRSVKYRQFPPNFFHLFLLSTLSSVISQALHFIHSLMVHLCTVDPAQTSFSTLFTFSFLTEMSLSASGGWKFQYNLPAWLSGHCSWSVLIPAGCALLFVWASEEAGIIHFTHTIHMSFLPHVVCSSKELQFQENNIFFYPTLPKTQQHPERF